MWEPLCYTRIGGLTVRPMITLVTVPVLYAIVVLDLKLVRWETPEIEEHISLGRAASSRRSSGAAQHLGDDDDLLGAIHGYSIDANIVDVPRLGWPIGKHPIGWEKAVHE